MIMRNLLFLSLFLLSFPVFQADAAPAMIGSLEEYRTVREDDTLIEIAYREDVGYVELRAANPKLDPWLPGENEKVILPKQHILPTAKQKGIVINLGEMRLYFFPSKGEIQSYPLGIGREGLLTPHGSTTVVRKAEDPIWRPTPRMIKEKPELKPEVLPGPDNPMGPRALYLGWAQYAIHGTNTPWGIGRRVSSGCLRMYNEDVKKLYPQVPVGTQVTVVNEPVKTAWVDGVFYIEAHPNAQQADAIVKNAGKIDYDVSEQELEAITKKVGDKYDAIDWGKVRKALRYRPGYPMAVSDKVEDSVKKDEPETKNVKTEDKKDKAKTVKSDVKKAKPEKEKPVKEMDKKADKPAAEEEDSKAVALEVNA